MRTSLGYIDIDIISPATEYRFYLLGIDPVFCWTSSDGAETLSAAAV